MEETVLAYNYNNSSNAYDLDLFAPARKAKPEPKLEAKKPPVAAKPQQVPQFPWCFTGPTKPESRRS